MTLPEILDENLIVMTAGVVITAIAIAAWSGQGFLVGVILMLIATLRGMIRLPLYDVVQRRQKARELPLRLARQRDFSSLSGLAELLFSGGPHMKREARDHLVHLLPTVQKSHAEYLPALVQRGLIGIVLDSAELDIELAHALLAALRIVGHPEALDDLEFFAIKEHWRHPVDEDLFNELAECCVILRSRAERLEQKSHLLRAAAADPSSMLLHPARGVQDEEAEILLRTTEDSAR
jgi:hypothetical protein